MEITNHRWPSADMSIMRIITGFFSLNRRLSKTVEKFLPADFTAHLHTSYKHLVASAINSRPVGQRVLDIGGGKDCPFLAFVSDPASHVVIALDFSEYELRHNKVVHQKLAADATASALPFAAQSIDLVVSRSVMEHLPDNSAFFRNSTRVLKYQGVFIHTFPCKYAPFALLNQILPNWLTRRLLTIFHPSWSDECGFRAFYNRCYPSAVRAMLAQHGFSNVRVKLRFYQSIYFDFFFPLYILMLTYDLITWALNIETLACGMLVTATYDPVAAGSADSPGRD